jgi:DNA-binding HxlR family transcriptional regulator
VEARRTYGESCTAAHALDLVGERWALLVVRELLLGPKRFSDLRASLPRASPRILTERLRELERDGVLRRRRLGPPVSSVVYELTAWGQELEAVVLALGRWGRRSPLLDLDAPVSGDAVMIALRGRFDPEAGRGLTATLAVRFARDQLSVRVDGGRLTIGREDAPAPDATIETDPGTLAALLTHRLSLCEAVEAGRLAVTGDAGAVAALLAATPAPISR